jgi:hypothetical protein
MPNDDASFPHREAHRAAYVAAAHAFAAMAVRNLLSIEGDDPEVGAVMVECSGSGDVAVTLLDPQARPIGGFSL